MSDSDEIEIEATTVGTRTFRVDRAEYEQALADGEVDDLFDVYVSDMDEKTTYATPDGRIHAYPSGEVIGDDVDQLRIALERIAQAAEQYLMTDGDEARRLELRRNLGEAVTDASLVLYPGGSERGAP